MKRESRAPLIAAIVLLLLPVLYAVSYLALVKPGPQLIFAGPSFWDHRSKQVESVDLINEDFGGETNYRWGGSYSARIFWPLEQIDRKLRPAAWDPFPNPFKGRGSN